MNSANIKDLEKMTIAQLKDALSKKSLATDGKKAVLVDRLAESIRNAEEEAILNSTVDSDILPSDDILNTDSDVLAELSSESKGDSTDSKNAEAKEKLKIQAPLDEKKEDQLKRAQRLGLPIGNVDVSSEDAKKKRAERFGIVPGATDHTAKAKRAERFGTVPATLSSKNVDEESKEKLLKRAQRFGIPVNADGKLEGSRGATDEILAKRAARFGVNNNDEKMEAAKQARLQRFSQ